jgi:hypothetical protein
VSYYLDRARDWARASESDWEEGHQPTAVRKAIFAIANTLIAMATFAELEHRASFNVHKEGGG